MNDSAGGFIPGIEEDFDIEDKLIDHLAQRNESLLKRQEEGLDEYIAFLESEVPRFNITVFEEHFLEYFLNNSFTAEAAQTWIREVAGGPTAPVHLINDEGEIVVTVPGIINTSELDPDPGSTSKDTIGALTETLEQEKGVFSLGALDRFENSLQERLNKKIRTSKLTQAFFDYYSDKVKTGAPNEISGEGPDTFSESTMFI